MKIYTKTGDDGTTGLLGAGRLRKDDVRIDAYGTVDELNASVGVARSCGPLPGVLDGWLAEIQDDLFTVGAALADPNPEGKFHGSLTSQRVERLERMIDEAEADLAPLSQFILPGGSPSAARLHFSRTVCRRAERRVVELGHTPGQSVATEVLVYLNRLSDLLFVMARAANQQAGQSDVPWRGPAR